jgi:inosine/xanthosine triphosphatase
MIITVGSINPVKVKAVEEVIKKYARIADAQVLSFSVPSQVSEQPLSLKEIIQGAKNRARNAFNTPLLCNYGFGIESGLFEVPESRTGYLESCVCCIYDGVNYYIGLSCGFEIPPRILDLILNKGITLSVACYESGITNSENLGSEQGLIGILTEGKINRKEYTKQSIITALIQIQNSDWYTIRNESSL